jgi:hypothetical protein
MKTKNNLCRTNLLLLKLISLLFGFAFWYLFIHQQIGYEQRVIPLCFHDLPPDLLIKAPEIIQITVRGKRTDLYSLENNNLAFHIDARKLKKGNNTITLQDHQLYLPEHLTLLSCSPSTILVCVYDKKN